MAGASLNSIKSRIKSVDSTRQITKAMELVATSKLRLAKEKAEQSRAYQQELLSAVYKFVNLAGSSETNCFINPPKSNKTCYIVIAGDRGLAGGYNNNIFKLFNQEANNESYCVIPIGKKAYEYFQKRNAEIIDLGFRSVNDLGINECSDISKLLADEYLKANIDKIVVIYTEFVSMLTQNSVSLQLLPLTYDGKGEQKDVEFICDSDPIDLVNSLVPFCISGLLYTALCEAIASEHGSRRNAMNSANKNADEIIADLTLKFNRARQAAITQEITEIVSGADAL